MKNKRKIINLPLIVITLIIVIIIWQCFSIVNTPLKINDEEIVEVTEGESFYGILNELSNEGKIKNEILVKLYLKVKNIQPDILAGTYKLDKSMTLSEIIDLFSNESSVGKVYITIPEGYTVDDIAEVLENNKICTKEDFIKAVEEYELPSYIVHNPNKKYDLEGFLFPDTYTFVENEDANLVVTNMIKRFETVWNEIVTDLNLSIPAEKIEEKITVASIIEKEAVVDSERSLIASVIYNRLDIHMPLQIDATVIYAHGYHINKMYESDLEIDSPYNTYMYYGLPVGPISNPGRASIIAALQPEATDYLFYLLESENTHYFTDNYDDFLNRKEELGYYMEE